ncbi:MAG: hypothetical protein ACOH1U_13005 [Rhodoglobus sp.]
MTAQRVLQLLDGGLSQPFAVDVDDGEIERTVCRPPAEALGAWVQPDVDELI